MEQYKSCPACKQTKPYSDFFKNKQTKTGRSCYCKPCHSFKLYGPPKGRRKIDPEIKKQRRKEYLQKWMAKNPEKVSEYQKKYYWKNRETELEKNKEYRQANREKERIRHKRYLEKNPDSQRANRDRRRARVYGTKSEPYTKEQILELYGTDCHVCGDPIDLSAPRKPGAKGWEKGLHLDHVVSLVDGGTDTVDNIKPAHGLCNLRKH